MPTRSKVSRAAILAILTLATVSPAAAFHRTDPPLATFPLTGNGSVSARVVLPEEGPLELEVYAPSTNATSWGIGLYVNMGSGWSGGALTATGSRTEMHVELPAVGELIDERQPGGGGAAGMAIGFGSLEAGEYTVVLGGATDGDLTGEAKIWAGEGATVTASTTGSAFMYREADFNEGLNVVAGSPAGAAKAIVASSVTETVDGSLFAWFGGHGFDPVAVLSYSGPGGTGGTGTAHFLYASPPGDYTFTIDTNVGAGPFTGVWAWGLDVTPA